MEDVRMAAHLGYWPKVKTFDSTTKVVTRFSFREHAGLPKVWMELRGLWCFHAFTCMNVDLDRKETSYFIDAVSNHCKGVNDLFACG